MNQKRYLCALAILVAGLLLFAEIALSGGIKERMKARLPKIIELKAAGIVGETSQGFLAFVGANQPEQALVAAENKDRQMVYEAIAKQQGTTAAVVGQRRALQIAEKANPGEWLRDAGGTWHKK